jgi:GAF domain-containing protein
MQRFIVKQNIERFQTLLDGEHDETRRVPLARLLAEAQRELAWLEGIWSWTCPHLGVPDSLGAEAEELLERVARGQGADYASLQLWDGAGRSLCLLAHRNFDRSSVERFATVRDGAGSVCEAAQVSQAPVMVGDIEADNSFASLRDWTRTLGIRAIQTTPLFGRSGKFVGAFSTHFANPRNFSDGERARNASSAELFSRLFANMGRG